MQKYYLEMLVKGHSGSSSPNISPIKLGIGTLIILLMFLLSVDYLGVVAGYDFEYSFEQTYLAKDYTVTRVGIGLNVIDGVVVMRYEDFSRDPVTLIIGEIARRTGGGLEEADFDWMIKVGYNDVLRDLYNRYPSLGSVYPIDKDTYLLVVMGTDESKVLRDVLGIAGYMRSGLGLSSIDVYYIQLPIDPYVPDTDLYHYSELYSSLMASGKVPNYLFMFTITNRVPEFGAWLSCEAGGSRATHDYYEVVNSVRSLADKMFGKDAKVVLHIVSGCGGLEPLVDPGSSQAVSIGDQLAPSGEEDKETEAPTDSGSPHMAGEIASPYPYITLLIALSIAIPTAYLLLRRVSGI